MNKISACLVLRNEGENIRRCLESLRGAVDEIIIAHDGECSDDTLNICQKYTEHVYVRPFVGYMEAHLQFVFAKASGDWILRIDGDEFLSDELNDNLRKIVASGNAEAYSFIWPIWNGKKIIASTGSHKLALFLKDRVGFLGIIHFKLAVKGRTVASDFILNHRPNYNNFTINTFISKWIPWAHLDAAMYFKKIPQIETFNYAGRYLPLNLLIRKYFAPILLMVSFPIFLLKGLRKSLIYRNLHYLKIDAQFGIYRTLVEFFVIFMWIKMFVGWIKKGMAGKHFEE